MPTTPPIVYAIKEGNLEKVKSLIQNGDNVNDIDIYGDSALIIATKLGNEQIVQFLLANRANVNQQGVNGKTAIMWAASRGNIPIMTMLLNYKGSGGKSWNPLNKNKPIDVNMTSGMMNGSETALYLACQSGKIDAVRLLIERGADINKSSGIGSTPMTAAWSGKHYPIVELLQQKGAKQTSEAPVPMGAELQRIVQKYNNEKQSELQRQNQMVQERREAEIANGINMAAMSQSPQGTGSYSSSNGSSSRPAGQSMGSRTGFSLGRRRGGKMKTNKRRKTKKRKSFKKRRN